MRKNPYMKFQDGDEGDDPLSGMANLFDLAMVFAVALMVAFAMKSQMTEMLTKEDVTFIKNAGKNDMEIIVKKDNVITKYKSRETAGEGKGRRVGIAYELDNGDIVYIPETGT